MGDTDSISATVAVAVDNLEQASQGADDESDVDVAEHFSELVADKGYHSNAVISVLHDDEIRTYIAEPDRGRRTWNGEDNVRDAIYANRRRIKGNRGKQLLRSRRELIERPFAHLHETGGMRRTHLRHHDNIQKRLFVHTAAFNLSLMMRKHFGVGKPRRLQGRAGLKGVLLDLLALSIILWRSALLLLQRSAFPSLTHVAVSGEYRVGRSATFSTGW